MRYMLSKTLWCFTYLGVEVSGEAQNKVKSKEESYLFQGIVSLRESGVLKDRETNLTEKKNFLAGFSKDFSS